MHRNRGRIEKFTSVNQRATLSATKNHTFSADQYIDSTFKVVLKTNQIPIEDEKFEGYFDDDVRPLSGDLRGNLVQYDTYPRQTLHLRYMFANYMLKNTFIRPQTSNNQNVLPQDQSEILPYLCEESQKNSIFPENRESFNLGHGDVIETTLLLLQKRCVILNVLVLR